ncbi:MAG: acylphosphatase [Bacteroidota bacterium]
MITKQIQVFGRVQGVFFRASTKEKAENLKLKGWVRNEPNGSVLIEVTGEQEIVEELEKWCYKGPEHSRVERVKPINLPLKEYTRFSIII